ncbi:MAG: DUF1553 domain-containing protein [Bacteroidota bacterium]
MKPAFLTKQRLLKLCGCMCVLMWSCRIDLPDQVAVAYEELPAQLAFNIDIKPLLSDRCYQCHGPDEQAREAELRLDVKEGLFARTENGKHAFVSGSPRQSEAIRRILSDDPEEMMPPPSSNYALNAAEKAALIKWVEEGAQWQDHWSFIVPERPPLPQPNSSWTQENEIDLFVQERLTQHQLSPAPKADKSNLLRRLSIDLTGLPPTIEEMAAFHEDDSPDAYVQLVDRLLNSDAHAERMTLEWLDVARYADSHGFHVDGLRTMWPWRDWVIDAFRQNMPYDQFVTEQLAGDLLPNASKDQIIATAFNRNHPMTAEGGAVDEEYRVEYVSNRTNTFGTALLGLTVECAKCHDHKFDPIAQKEYYQLSGFFNNVWELGMTGNDGDFGPMLLLSDDSTEQKISQIDRQIQQLEATHNIEKQDLLAITNFIHKVGSREIHPMVYHPFEQLTKTDSSAFLDGRPMTKQRDTDPVDGIAGKARYFNHQDDKISIFGYPHFEHTNPFSVSMWIRPDEETGRTKVLIGNSGEKNNLWRGWDFYLDSTNHLTVRLISNLPHNYLHLRTRESITYDRWTQVGFTYDGSAKAEGVRLYVDGKQKEGEVVYDRLFKSMIPVKTARTQDQRGLVVGKSRRAFTGDNGVFRGSIDELVIFEQELFPRQIQAVYELSKQGQKAIVEDISHSAYRSTLDQLTQLRKRRLALVDPIQELMVMEEMTSARPTFILDRGEYDKPGEQVWPGTPQKVLPFEEDYPANRLGLSQWLFNEKNPLTARVAVNRYWQMLFGQGIVRTAHDFGIQGALPSHPELLDYLAREFQESGWDVRALIRMMVLSHTYRQASKSSPALRETDPTNVYLARSPSYRWQAEFIRDNALMASGLLNPVVGGESVKPYQPDGLWIELGNFSHFLLHYQRDEDERQYRKSMYTFLRRTSPAPFMTIFDAPSREVCTITRERTNTPLQALVLLNDPQFLEASRALAVRLKQEGGESIQPKIRLGFQLVLSRFPSEKEMAVMENLYQEEYQQFQKDQQKVSEFLAVGDYRLPESYDPVEMAALAMVANTLFNMDEVYMKR